MDHQHAHDKQLPPEQMIQTLEKKVYDLRNLIEMGMSLTSNLVFERLVESILYSCIGQMFVEKVAILLQVDIDIDNYHVHTAKGYDQDVVDGAVMLVENAPLVRYLNENAAPQDFTLLWENETLRSDLSRMEVLSPELIVPMKSKNQLNGILVLGPKITAENFSSDERDFLTDLAKFAAIGVENSRLYLMATLDRMTRLYIHHYFQERLTEEVKRSHRYNTPMTLLISDIDHFKGFNDTYGHQQGDIVLKEVAKLFKQNLRVMDVPARYGGEEFAVILPETALADGVKVANRLRKCVEEHEFPGQGEPLHVTVSIGVAQYDPALNEERAELIKRADAAMYSAKHAGRNKVAVHK
ncbi:MAG TPA: sensor domain-containing diguanylate cyclase [Spirochaetota bacterium]|nr:sensor domain-containing diguanylate cyclase [Spirochaetota bacterium]HNT12253.1 sensor domain-containing diguanylate cyclase [Spirochaetota bacterium]HNV47097.1 sensor domain-containing diguanylate cyclase [Spirochaetota bacterium]HOS40585.1 sensor domain-containing diguanylate cyclase [Spirochaetota bacterium]HPU87935.1 sensor domain-containing diguanylate cyclase [Spirochaetota bacterium]